MLSGRPLPGEFADYAADDIAYVVGDSAVDALRQQGEDVLARLATWTEEAVSNRRYAEDKWTLKEILGHLIDDERIFVYRALCVARGDTRPLAGFDEKAYVAATDFESRTLESLMDEYRTVRASSIAFFDALTQEEWQRRGIVNGYEASVRGLAFHVAAHELHHLRIVDERYGLQVMPGGFATV